MTLHLTVVRLLGAAPFSRKEKDYFNWRELQQSGNDQLRAGVTTSDKSPRSFDRSGDARRACTGNTYPQSGISGPVPLLRCDDRLKHRLRTACANAAPRPAAWPPPATQTCADVREHGAESARRRRHRRRRRRGSQSADI